MSARTRSFASFSRRALVLLALGTTLAGSALTATTAAAAPLRSALERWVLLYDRVEAFDTEVVRVTIAPGVHSLWVDGDRDTDLDCRLYQNGVLVDVDLDPTDLCLLDTRGRSGTFRLTIENLGPVYNAYSVEAER
jgi:hypothetical protein